MFKRRDIVTVLVTMCSLIIIGILVFIVLNINKTDYVILREDINNSCSPDGLSTAVAQNIVEIQVPESEVDEYLQKAVNAGRCISRDAQ